MSGGSSARTVYISNQQRIGYFDELKTFTSGSFYAEDGLMTTGVVVGHGTGAGTSVRYDELPADNTLDKNILESTYQGDLYSPTSSKQISPWTKPNINGFTDYPTGFSPSWESVDNIRYTGGANGQMAFDFIDDIRDNAIVREDSWIGSETDGQIIDSDLVVEAGATLTIEAGTTLRFTSGHGIKVYGDLKVEGTSANRVVLTASSSSWNGIRFYAGSDGDLENVDVTNVNGGAGGGAVRFENGADGVIDGASIEVTSGSYVYGVYVVSTGTTSRVDLRNSRVKSSSAPAIYVSGSSADLNMQNNDIVQDNGSTAVISTGSADLRFRRPFGTGLNKIADGKLYATGGGSISAGSSSSKESQNHFCDASSSSLEANSSGVIEARHNYWHNNVDPAQNDNGGSGEVVL